MRWDAYLPKGVVDVVLPPSEAQHGVRVRVAALRPGGPQEDITVASQNIARARHGSSVGIDPAQLVPREAIAHATHGLLIEPSPVEKETVIGDDKTRGDWS